MTKEEALSAPVQEHVALIDRLTNPEQHYEFTDPKKANAVLMSLCQEAADALAAPVQEPVAVDQATMELAESVGLIGPASRTHDLHAAIQRFHDLICVNATIKAAKMAADAIRESTLPAAPVAWKWHQAPIKTSWGHEMVVADLAIGKDNTVSVYCERDQTAKVEAMFNPHAQPAPVPDAIHHTDLSETLEYIQGWNDCRAEMLGGKP